MGTSHFFGLADLPMTRWKNGGGSTREIVAWPLGTTVDTFLWRVSVATIDMSGPFSVFSAVDRTLMLLDGAPLRLQGRDARFETEVAQLESCTFPGDLQIDCELLGSHARAFNVMTRRGRVSASVEVVREAARLDQADAGLLFCVRGLWRIGEREPCELRADSGVWWAERSTAWEVCPLGASLAALIFVRFC